jgi:hybrid cluster-associated redox disulfide protein
MASQTKSTGDGGVEEGVCTPGVAVTKRPAKDRNTSSNSEEIVTRHWTVSEIITHYPQATEVMAEYGLHCFGCSASGVESLEEGCLGHGFSEEDISNLVEDINDVIASTPAKPQVLSITQEAALAIKDIAAKEKMEGQGLSVQANKDGSFFMEFREMIEEGEKEFCCDDVPEIKVWASVLTLQRVGGASITFKEGRFKLEIENGGCCGEKEACDCK